MKYIFVPKTWNLKLKGVSCIKFAETCGAGGKWAKEYSLWKYLPIFIFIPDLWLLSVKILKAYNYKTR